MGGGYTNSVSCLDFKCARKQTMKSNKVKNNLFNVNFNATIMHLFKLMKFLLNG